MRIQSAPRIPEAKPPENAWSPLPSQTYRSTVESEMLTVLISRVNPRLRETGHAPAKVHQAYRRRRLVTNLPSPIAPDALRLPSPGQRCRPPDRRTCGSTRGSPINSLKDLANCVNRRGHEGLAKHLSRWRAETFLVRSAYPSYHETQVGTRGNKARLSPILPRSTQRIDRLFPPDIPARSWTTASTRFASSHSTLLCRRISCTHRSHRSHPGGGGGRGDCS